MSRIVLSPKGVFYSYFDNEIEEWVSDEVESILPFLNEGVETTETFTVSDFIKILKVDEDVLNKIYEIELSDYEISDLYNELNGHHAIDEDININGVLEILIESTGIITKSNIEDLNNNIELFDYPEFIYESESDGTYLPVECLPLHHIKNTDIIITNQISIDIEKLNTSETGEIQVSDIDVEKFFTGKKSITLNDFIHVMLINFCLIGNPQNKMIRRKELMNMLSEKQINNKIVDDLFNELNNGDGK